MSEWSRSWSAKPDIRRFDSGCGLVRHPLWLAQAGAGCPSAPHKGGAPGSTPGPATDGRGHRFRLAAGSRDRTRPPLRCEACRLLLWVMSRRPRRRNRTRRVPQQKTALPGAQANGYFDWYESACEADAWVQVPQAGRRPDLGKPNHSIRTSPVRRRSVTSRFESPRAPNLGASPGRRAHRTSTRSRGAQLQTPDARCEDDGYFRFQRGGCGFESRRQPMAAVAQVAEHQCAVVEPDLGHP